jgi:hypothetical protein
MNYTGENIHNHHMVLISVDDGQYSDNLLQVYGLSHAISVEFLSTINADALSHVGMTFVGSVDHYRCMAPTSATFLSDI